MLRRLDEDESDGDGARRTRALRNADAAMALGSCRRFLLPWRAEDAALFGLLFVSGTVKRGRLVYVVHHPFHPKKKKNVDPVWYSVVRREGVTSLEFGYSFS